MENLIEALQIFLKYQNVEFPTHCEHDVLQVVDITEDEVLGTDILRLAELGFHYSEDAEAWLSYHFGSA